MGTTKTYSLYTINPENKVDEIYDNGKRDKRYLILLEISDY